MIKQTLTIFVLSTALMACSAHNPSNEQAGSDSSSYKTIAPISAMPVNGKVRVSGKVNKIYDNDEIVLSDNSGKVDIFTNHNHLNLHIGEPITVAGTLNPGHLKQIIGYRKEIIAKKVILENGKEILIV